MQLLSFTFLAITLARRSDLTLRFEMFTNIEQKQDGDSDYNMWKTSRPKTCMNSDR
jgi:hypothetical protein